MLKRTLLVTGMAAVISLATSAPSFAHDPSATCTNQPCGWHQGWHMGPMMGHGMMGQQGQMPMMGQGQGPMMGQRGQMPMTGQGMMGPGYGMGQGMGHGMMGQRMGPGMMQPLRQDLTAAEVKHMIGHQLAWQGNPNVKVGTVEEKDDDTIVAEIVTQDGSLVQRLQVDRHTGRMQPAQ